MRLICAILLASLFIGCASSGASKEDDKVEIKVPGTTFFPSSGYDHTLNFKIQGRVKLDKYARCEKITVIVKEQNKLYLGWNAPDLLRLTDEDCRLPRQFDRATYREKEQVMQLSGSRLQNFLAENAKLENELMQWMFKNGLLEWPKR